MSNFSWAEHFDEYIHAMTWGHGYGGEAYWREEEDLLLKLFGDKNIRRCLSVGCGLFREQAALMRIASEEVVGIEKEQKFVDYVVQRLPAPDKPRIRVIHGDMASMVRLDKNFDLVCVLFHTIGFFPNIGLALQKCLRATNPGGHCVLTVWRDDPQITAIRKRLYTSSGDKQAAVEYNSALLREDIVVRKNQKEVFRSPILTRAYMDTFFNVLRVKPQIFETTMMYLMAIRQ